MKTLVKNQLFNFVTLRNPQLIAAQDKELGFVFHPDATQSTFYEAVKNVISRIKTYPDLQLPTFSTQKTTQIAENYLNDKISDVSQNIMKSQGWNQLETFQEEYTAIGTENKSRLFCFSALDEILPIGKHGINMTLAVDTPGLTVANATSFFGNNLDSFLIV